MEHCLQPEMSTRNILISPSNRSFSEFLFLKHLYFAFSTYHLSTRLQSHAVLCQILWNQTLFCVRQEFEISESGMNDMIKSYHLVAIVIFTFVLDCIEDGRCWFEWSCWVCFQIGRHQMCVSLNFDYDAKFNVRPNNLLLFGSEIWFHFQVNFSLAESSLKFRSLRIIYSTAHFKDDDPTARFTRRATFRE